MSTIYHEITQGSQEWLDLRMTHFTASELGEWILEPLRITKTVKQLEAILDAAGISRKGVTKRDGLIELLPDKELLMELCDGAKTAIRSKIKQERLLVLRSRDYDSLAFEERIWLDRETELAEKSAKSFEYNIPVKYGNLLEPFAKSAYESLTGYEVQQVGFISYGDGKQGFGCSPDGLVVFEPDRPDSEMHGLELKSPIPETHLAWWDEYELTGEMPECHRIQVHACMAVSGLDRWDFMSYCPGETHLRVPVYRDDTTEKVLAGLKAIVAEKAKMKARLADRWNQSITNPSYHDTPKNNS